MFKVGDVVRVNHTRSPRESNQRWGPFDEGDVGVVVDATYLGDRLRVHVKFFRGTEDIFRPGMLSYADLT